MHKLWYVLLKERNCLITQRRAYERVGEIYPSPERLVKVRKSMATIKAVLTERAFIESGDDAEKLQEWKNIINAH